MDQPDNESSGGFLGGVKRIFRRNSKTPEESSSIQEPFQSYICEIEGCLRRFSPPSFKAYESFRKCLQRVSGDSLNNKDKDLARIIQGYYTKTSEIYKRNNIRGDYSDYKNLHRAKNEFIILLKDVLKEIQQYALLQLGNNHNTIELTSSVLSSSIENETEHEKREGKNDQVDIPPYEKISASKRQTGLIESLNSNPEDFQKISINTNNGMRSGEPFGSPSTDDSIINENAQVIIENLKQELFNANTRCATKNTECIKINSKFEQDKNNLLNENISLGNKVIEYEKKYNNEYQRRVSLDKDNSTLKNQIIILQDEKQRELKQQKFESEQQQNALRRDLKEFKDAVDVQQIYNKLKNSLSDLPIHDDLQQFIKELIDIFERTFQHDINWLKESVGASDRDKFVYTLPRPVAFFNKEGFSYATLLHQIIYLQQEIDAQIKISGVRIICPDHQEVFDKRYHISNEQDFVWVNNDKSLHNKIYSVLRVGFARIEKGSNGQVCEVILRKATVRRYLFDAGVQPTEVNKVTAVIIPDPQSSVIMDPMTDHMPAVQYTVDTAKTLELITDVEDRVHMPETSEALGEDKSALSQPTGDDSSAIAVESPTIQVVEIISDVGQIEPTAYQERIKEVLQHEEMHTVVKVQQPEQVEDRSTSIKHHPWDDDELDDAANPRRNR